MKSSWVHSGGRAASRARLNTAVLLRGSGGEVEQRRAADHQRGHLAVAVEPGGRDERRLERAAPPGLAEDELVGTDGGAGQDVMGQDALLALGEVALHRFAA